jgi:hypothetical protein
MDEVKLLLFLFPSAVGIIVLLKNLIFILGLHYPFVAIICWYLIFVCGWCFCGYYILVFDICMWMVLVHIPDLAMSSACLVILFPWFK